LIPQLFTGKLSREEIEETLARLLESTKHLIPTPEEETPVKVKEEPVSEDESDIEMEGAEPIAVEGSEPSHGLKTQPGIKTDDIPSSTDLKKMTSKERRQLRNKISARNFRVRRKGEWTVMDIDEGLLLLSALWIYPSHFLLEGGGEEVGERRRGGEKTWEKIKEKQSTGKEHAETRRLAWSGAKGGSEAVTSLNFRSSLPLSSLVGPLWMV
jgi:hypothetical protein